MMVVLPLAGFALLAVGTYRPSQLVFGNVPARRHRLASLAGGYALLLLSFGRTLRGPARDVVGWCGHLTLAALLIVAAIWLIAHRRAHR